MKSALARLTSSGSVLALLVALGCDSARANARIYRFSVHISGDPGQPVADASLTFKGKRVAVSDNAGVARLEAHGQEGETVDFGITCPEGYRSPVNPLALRLTHLSEGSRTPEYQVTCAPALRDVVIAV